MPNTKQFFRPRISLMTLLLLVAIFAMGIVIWQLNAELIPLRTEVRKLRDENGQLTIDQPEKIHAIQMGTDYPLAWKWRVYIPEGRKVRIAHINHQISEDTPPDARDRLPESKNDHILSGPKEYVVTVKLDKMPDGRWRSGVSCDGVTTYQIVPDDASKWLKSHSSGSSIAQVDRKVSVESAGEALVLLRRRVFYNRGQIPPVNKPAETDGLLVWLDE